MKVFKVWAKSLNTNSFGLYRMVVVAADGTAFEAHANSFNVRDEGCILPTREDGSFYGCEMCNQLPAAPQEIVDALYTPEFKRRLEELRKELQAECISTGELLELQNLVRHIDPADVELLEAAGVPENEGKDDYTEDNKLIAEFMGYTHQSDSAFKDENGFWNDFEVFETWDWLMPVVEKIEGLDYFCMINRWTSVYTGSDGDRIQITTVEGKSKLQNTLEAVVKFIKWYNANRKAVGVSEN